MKKLFYVLSILSLLTIILFSIFFSWYIAFALIIWVLCFGYGIYKFRNSSNENEYEEKDEKMDEEEKDEEVNLKLSSDEEKIVDNACELITKFYFSKDYEEFIKNLSSGEIRVINNWFADTKKSDSDIFQSVKIEDFEKMLYLSSGLCYDKNGNPTEEYKKAIGTYNKIKIAAKNLLQNNNLLTNITDNEDFESNCLRLLGPKCFFVSCYLAVFYPQYFENEKIIPNFSGMDISLQKRWIEKCQEIKKNGFEIQTKSEIFSCENNNFLTGDYGYYTTGSQNHFKNDEIS